MMVWIFVFGLKKQNKEEEKAKYFHNYIQEQTVPFFYLCPIFFFYFIWEPLILWV